MITERELATILAALRFWSSFMLQSNTDSGSKFADIASNGGEFEPLDDNEIDVLAERLNFGDAP